ncbi:hypothetical protein SDC9_150675 [bioreactor metagenome]|uniref:Uncharacterized protein n=1 Tax=bioreactor metagenome TaxID=1076179 RepID=A0A645EN49_9ZZZZ
MLLLGHEHLHVPAGAKAAARAGEHDHAHVRVGLGVIKRRKYAVHQLRIDAVERFRPVHRNERHAVCFFDGCILHKKSFLSK